MTGNPSQLTPDGSVALACVAALLTITFSTTQAFIGARVGSDHPVHVFLTRNIRDSGFRLLARIPRLLNTCYCAAVPLYLHWIISHFRTAAVYWCERLLNPVVNTMHVALFVLLALLAARSANLPIAYVGYATCAFALTPQFYHALSARNFGLSARGIGLLLLTLFFLDCYLVKTGVAPAPAWLALAVVGWLVWGFSTFAQQTLCICSVILLILSREYIPLAGTLLGLAVFIVIHPRYSLSYLRYTLRFLQTYRRELAPIYILASRPSVWRDLIWDIWRKRSAGLMSAVRYAYGNSLLVVLLLNPLSILTCWAEVTGRLPPNGIIAFAGKVALAGILAMLLTSFRPTRFLGEPERYVEAVSPWSVICAVYLLVSQQLWLPLAGTLIIFLLLNLGQLCASTLLFRHLDDTQSGQLAGVEAEVRRFLPHGVRFCSNNEHFTKMLMQNDWQYAYCLAVGQDYCGMKVQEAFAAFPQLRREACERIVATYRVNACLLDRSLFDTLFDQQPSGLQRMNVVYESPRFRLLVLDWAPAGG